MQRHWSALAGCESARLACNPPTRLPKNDRPSKNDRKESGSGLTRILLALQSFAANQSCARWHRKSSCLSQVPPVAGWRRAGAEFATSVNVGSGPTCWPHLGKRDAADSSRERDGMASGGWRITGDQPPGLFRSDFPSLRPPVPRMRWPYGAPRGLLGQLRREQRRVRAAWKRASRERKPYLSVKLDSLFLAAPVNAALIEQEDGTHALIWSRRRPTKQPTV